jgi:hypothetical protein
MAIGLLLMGIGVGAFLTREFYRRNLEAVIEQEIEKRCPCGDHRHNPALRRPTQPVEQFVVRLEGGHSPKRAG